jgi:hypothetical protein
MSDANKIMKLELAVRMEEANAEVSDWSQPLTPFGEAKEEPSPRRFCAVGGSSKGDFLCEDKRRPG